MASLVPCPSRGFTRYAPRKAEVRTSAVHCRKVNNPSLSTPSLSLRKVFAMCWMFKPFPLCQFDPLCLAFLQKGGSLRLSLLFPTGSQRRRAHGSVYAQSTVPACPQPAAAMAERWPSQAGLPAREGSQAVTSSRKSSWRFSVETRGWSAAPLAMKSSFLGMCWGKWGLWVLVPVDNYLKIRPEKNLEFPETFFNDHVSMWCSALSPLNAVLASAAGFRWMALLNLTWQPLHICVYSSVQLTPPSCYLSPPHTTSWCTHSCACSSMGPAPGCHCPQPAETSARQTQRRSFYYSTI